MYTKEEKQEVQPRRRRRHSAEFKQKVIQACLQPGISVAVALHHRLNANLLRRRMAAHEARNTAAPGCGPMILPSAEFVALPLGAARPHHAYVFANKSATRIKVLVYDGFGLWLAARRLNRGRFVWADCADTPSVGLNADQLCALAAGLPWKTLAHGHAIAVV